MKVCPYQRYYDNQAGGGIGAIYKGASYQRGSGVGSFLGGLFRSILPLFKNGMKALGTEIFNTGSNVMSDINQHMPMGQSIKNRLIEAGQNLKRKASAKLEKMSGDGYKKPRITKTVRRKLPVKAKSKTRKKSSSPKLKDIFG